MKKRIVRIWVDADACPKVIKEHIFNFAQRLQIPTVLVANSSMHVPLHPMIKLQIVGKGDDVADKYIVDNLNEDDLVITADIPLAAQVVEKGALALNPRGEVYDEDNIGEILSMRNFMKELRDSGSITGGPATFNAKDAQQFTNSLNKILSKR